MAAEIDDPADRVPTPGGAPQIKARSRISMVWIIPLVALLIGGWLLWRTWAERGPLITVMFPTAAGIEAGKTPIRFRDVTIGMVESVALSNDLSHVVVTARMNLEAERHLTAETQFWVVQPRLTASGVSGLGTLFSGSYIGMLPGEGPSRRDFVGLEQPPVLDVGTPGRRFVLRAPRVGSISPGSQIYFRGVPVGMVLGSELDEDRNGVAFFIFIERPYEALVRPGTKFWNASGISVNIGANGVNLRTESLQSVLTGGIAFNLPVEASDQTPSPENTEFRLFDSESQIAELQYTERIPYIVLFEGSVSGLAPGSPVSFRGMQIGKVTGVELIIDYAARKTQIPVTIEIEPQRARVINLTGSLQPYDLMREMVQVGLRAQLQPANLITGELLVALDFFPDAAPAKLDMTSAKYPILPSIPSNLEILSSKATQLLDKLAALPLDQVVAEARSVLRSVDSLVAKDAAPAVKSAQPLIESLRRTSDQAKAALAEVEQTLQSTQGLIGDDSRVRYDLTRMIKEVTDMARSLRALTNSIERQPQSVIFGKEPGEADR